MSNLDRFENERYDGYRQEDYEICLLCNPSGKPKKTPSMKCHECGGYGEVPAGTTNSNHNGETSE